MIIYVVIVILVILSTYIRWYAKLRKDRNETFTQFTFLKSGSSGAESISCTTYTYHNNRVPAASVTPSPSQQIPLFQCAKSCEDNTTCGGFLFDTGTTTYTQEPGKQNTGLCSIYNSTDLQSVNSYSGQSKFLYSKTGGTVGNVITPPNINSLYTITDFTNTFSTSSFDVMLLNFKDNQVNLFKNNNSNQFKAQFTYGLTKNSADKFLLSMSKRFYNVDFSIIRITYPETGKHHVTITMRHSIGNNTSYYAMYNTSSKSIDWTTTSVSASNPSAYHWYLMKNDYTIRPILEQSSFWTMNNLNFVNSSQNTNIGEINRFYLYRYTEVGSPPTQYYYPVCQVGSTFGSGYAQGSFRAFKTINSVEYVCIFNKIQRFISSQDASTLFSGDFFCSPSDITNTRIEVISTYNLVGYNIFFPESDPPPLAGSKLVCSGVDVTTKLVVGSEIDKCYILSPFNDNTTDVKFYNILNGQLTEQTVCNTTTVESLGGNNCSLGLVMSKLRPGVNDIFILRENAGFYRNVFLNSAPHKKYYSSIYFNQSSQGTLTPRYIPNKIYTLLKINYVTAYNAYTLSFVTSETDTSTLFTWTYTTAPQPGLGLNQLLTPVNLNQLWYITDGNGIVPVSDSNKVAMFGNSSSIEIKDITSPGNRLNPYLMRYNSSKTIYYESLEESGVQGVTEYTYTPTDNVFYQICISPGTVQSGGTTTNIDVLTMCITIYQTQTDSTITNDIPTFFRKLQPTKTGANNLYVGVKMVDELVSQTPPAYALMVSASDKKCLLLQMQPFAFLNESYQTITFLKSSSTTSSAWNNTLVTYRDNPSYSFCGCYEYATTRLLSDTNTSSSTKTNFATCSSIGSNFIGLENYSMTGGVYTAECVFGSNVNSNADIIYSASSQPGTDVMSSLESKNMCMSNASDGKWYGAGKVTALYALNNNCPVLKETLLPPYLLGPTIVNIISAHTTTDFLGFGGKNVIKQVIISNSIQNKSVYNIKTTPGQYGTTTYYLKSNGNVIIDVTTTRSSSTEFVFKDISNSNYIIGLENKYVTNVWYSNTTPPLNGWIFADLNTGNPRFKWKIVPERLPENQIKNVRFRYNSSLYLTQTSTGFSPSDKFNIVYDADNKCRIELSSRPGNYLIYRKIDTTTYSLYTVTSRFSWFICKISATEFKLVSLEYLNRAAFVKDTFFVLMDTTGGTPILRTTQTIQDATVFTIESAEYTFCGCYEYMGPKLIEGRNPSTSTYTYEECLNNNVSTSGSNLIGLENYSSNAGEIYKAECYSSNTYNSNASLIYYASNAPTSTTGTSSPSVYDPTKSMCVQNSTSNWYGAGITQAIYAKNQSNCPVQTVDLIPTYLLSPVIVNIVSSSDSTKYICDQYFNQIPNSIDITIEQRYANKNLYTFNRFPDKRFYMYLLTPPIRFTCSIQEYANNTNSNRISWAIKTINSGSGVILSGMLLENTEKNNLGYFKNDYTFTSTYDPNMTWNIIPARLPNNMLTNVRFKYHTSSFLKSNSSYTLNIDYDELNRCRLKIGNQSLYYKDSYGIDVSDTPGAFFWYICRTSATKFKLYSLKSYNNRYNDDKFFIQMSGILTGIQGTSATKKTNIDDATEFTIEVIQVQGTWGPTPSIINNTAHYTCEPRETSYNGTNTTCLQSEKFKRVYNATNISCLSSSNTVLDNMYCTAAKPASLTLESNCTPTCLNNYTSSETACAPLGYEIKQGCWDNMQPDGINTTINSTNRKIYSCTGTQGNFCNNLSYEQNQPCSKSMNCPPFVVLYDATDLREHEGVLNIYQNKERPEMHSINWDNRAASLKVLKGFRFCGWPHINYSMERATGEPICIDQNTPGSSIYTNTIDGRTIEYTPAFDLGKIGGYAPRWRVDLGRGAFTDNSYVDNISSWKITKL